MVRFHVSPRDGVARRCNAGSGPNARGCRYGLGDNDHYATKAEANQAAEQSNKKVNGGTFNKKTKKNVSEDNFETYEIASGRVDDAKKLIGKINKKLKNFGFDGEYTYDLVEKFVEEFDENNNSYFVKKYNLTINNRSFSYDGYEIEAVVKSEGSGFIVNAFSNKDLKGYRPDEQFCEHCGHRRHRKKTFIVVKDGKRSQIGSSCMKAYCGVSVNGIQFLEENNTNVFNTDEEYWSDVNDSNTEIFTSSDNILAEALLVTDNGNNYFPSKFEKSSFNSLANFKRNNNVNTLNGMDHNEFKIKAKELVDNGSVDAFKKKILSMPSNSDYIANIQTLMKEDMVSSKREKLLFSAVSILSREKHIKKTNKDNFSDSFFGAVDEKVKNMTYGFVSSKKFYAENYYGDEVEKYVNILSGPNSEKIVVYSENNMENFVDDDKNVSFTSGRVKKHEEKNGFKQTVMSYMRVKKR